MNRVVVRNLLVITVAVFFMGEGVALAEPLDVIPGGETSLAFLGHGIMEARIPMIFDDDGPCPPHFSCESGWNKGGSKTMELPILAGMASLPVHETNSMNKAGGRMGNTMPLLIMGCVLISLSNFVKLCSRRQKQHVSLNSRGKALTA